MAEQLAVRLYGRHVADLLDGGDGLCALRYTAEGAATGSGARLSLALPPRPEVYPALGGAQRWAEALLPEGPAREALVAEWDVPAHDTFALLSVVGRDVAGAVTILPSDEDPARAGGRYERLTEDDLARLVDDVRRRPLGLNRERGVRLSLAGVQDKLLLHRPPHSRALHLPIDGATSTLILKPEPRGASGDGPKLSGLVANELLGLTLARACGLRAAGAAARDVAGRACLVVERYDRDRAASPPARLHQEDLLMALGRDHRLKYEAPSALRAPAAGGFAERRPVRSEPGPGLAELAGLVGAVLGAAGQARLLEAAAFNVALGNADAHARNYSLLLLPDGVVEWAPLYDLVCTRAFPELDTAAAQSVNGVDDLDAITEGDLVAEGAAWGLRREAAAGAVARVLDRLGPGLERAVRRAAAKGGDAAMLDHLRGLIAGRLAALH